MNYDTGQLFYQPINLNIFSLIKRIRSWIRIWIWGVCPECNSDAPKIDNCKVCKWDTTSPFRTLKKHEYWDKWKFNDWINSNIPPTKSRKNQTQYNLNFKK